MSLFHRSTLVLSISTVFLLTACGGSSDGDSKPQAKPPSIKASLVEHDGNFSWEIKENFTIKLVDQDNQPVAIKSCVTENATRLSVMTDCKSLTAHRLGESTIKVTGANDLTTTLTINGVPTKSPLQLSSSGSNSFNQVVTADGKILTWGGHGNGQLAVKDSKTMRFVQYPKNILQAENGNALSDIYQAVSSFDTNYALSSKGQVYGWGFALNSSTASAKPLNVLFPELVQDATGRTALNNIVRLAVSSRIDGALGGALGITDEGKLMQWGFQHASMPTGIVSDNQDSLTNLRAIALSSSTAYAANLTGKVYRWGLNPFAERSLNSVIDFDGKEITGVVKILTNNNRTLALTKDGKVYAWGLVSGANLGDPKFDNSTYRASIASHIRANEIQRANFVQYKGQPLSNIKDIAMTENTSYALTQSGNIYAWGQSSHGLLGNANENPTLRTATPDLVVSENKTGILSDVIAISSAQNSAIALKRDGSLVGWGNNAFGILTQDNTNAQFNYPVSIQENKAQPLKLLNLAKYTQLN